MGSELELDFESTESNEVSLAKKCPHLSGNINIGRVRKAVAARKGRSSAVKCQEKGCQAADLLWLCLQCGQVHCGRSENNHAELHSSSNPKHCLVINPSSLDVWCYACDDFLQSDRTKNQIIAEVKALFAQEKAKMERKALAAIPVPSAPSTGKSIKSDKDIKRARTKLPIPGLSNLGNTCFFNSTVQCLAYTKALEPYWGNQDSPEAASVIQKSLSRAFLNLINVMHAQRSAGKLSPVVSPVGLFTQLKQKYEMYRSMVQQDAHELLRTLLDGIREEQRPRDSETGKLIPYGGGGFVDDVFGGKLVSVVLCASCRGLSFRFEEFLDLSMSIGSDVGGSKDLAGGEQNTDKKWFNLLAAMRNRLSPNPSKQATPASSRPASPLQSFEADLEQAISKLSVNQSDCLLPPGTTAFNDREQQKLTEQLFRTLDTVKVQQGAAAAAELANSGKPKQLTLAKCFEHFLGCDVLDGENGLVCDNCNGKLPDNDTPPLPFTTKLRAAVSAPTISLSLDKKLDLPTSQDQNDVSDTDSLTSSETSAILDDDTIDPTADLPLPPSIPPLITTPASPSKPTKPQTLTNGYKRYLIHTYPRTLAIHLKRFERIGKSGTRTRKLDTHVTFPEILDIGMYLSPETLSEKRKGSDGEWEDVVIEKGRRDPDNGVYRLYGVVVHAGSLFGGHYVAYVRVPMKVEGDEGGEGDAWVYMSDGQVRLSSLEEVLGVQAYMLFYEHVDAVQQ